MSPQRDNKITSDQKLFPIFNLATTKKHDDVTKSTRGGKPKAPKKKPREIVEVSSPPWEETSPTPSVHPSNSVLEPNAKTFLSIFNLPIPSPQQAVPTRKVSTTRRKRRSSSPSNRAIEISSSSAEDNTPSGSQPRREQGPKRRKQQTVMDIDQISRAGSSSQPSRATSPTLLAPIFLKARAPLGTKLNTQLPSGAAPIVIDDEESPGARDCPIFLTSPLQPSNHVVKRRQKSSILPVDPVPWPTRQSQHILDVDFTRTVDGSGFIRRRPPHSSMASVGFISGSATDVSTHPPWAIQHFHREAGDAVIFDVSPTVQTETFESTLLSIPHSIMTIPAFKPVLQSLQVGFADEAKARETWADRWRPQAANHVLGNESATRYLKAWLRTLELDPVSAMTKVSVDRAEATPAQDSRKRKLKVQPQESKRPKIIRTVQKPLRKALKRSRNGYSEDWVVSDEEDEGSDNDTEDTLSDRPDEHPLQFRPSVSPRKPSISMAGPLPEADDDPPSSYNFDPLTNAILLVGPPGSTKTAAVYACAAELDWDIYEVNPGMGKRSGVNLRAIVDGVSKNHVIGMGNLASSRQGQISLNSQNSTAWKRKAPPPNFFGPRRGDDQRPPSGSQEVATPVRISNGPFHNFEPKGATPVENPSSGRIGKVKQSLILLEEVDILFAEDSNFWPAVIELIAASRRPVVMTCNDTSVVPLADLPLQTTLQFESPSEEVITSYVRCLGLAAGTVIPVEAAVRIVQDSKYLPVAADLQDQALHPLPSQEPPSLDLRKAINAAQIYCAMVPDHTPSPNRNARQSEDQMSDWAFVAPSDRTDETVGAADSLHILSRFMEHVSVANAHINRRLDRSLDASAIDRYEETPDDEMNYDYLIKPSYRAEDAHGLAFYSRDEEMAIGCLAAARGYLESQGFGAHYRREDEVSGGTCHAGPNEAFQGKLNSVSRRPTCFDSQYLFDFRAERQRWIVAFIDEALQTADVPLLPRPAMVLDYLPYLQRMIRTDDEEEAAFKEARLAGVADLPIPNARRGLIRQSFRIVTRGQHAIDRFDRYIPLGADALHAARRSRLVV